MIKYETIRDFLAGLGGAAILLFVGAVLGKVLYLLFSA